MVVIGDPSCQSKGKTRKKEKKKEEKAKKKKQTKRDDGTCPWIEPGTLVTYTTDHQADPRAGPLQAPVLLIDAHSNYVVVVRTRVT